MTWEISWAGLAGDYDPGNVRTTGTLNERPHAQAMARAVVDILEEYEPQERVIVVATGNIDGAKRSALSVSAKPEGLPVRDQLAAQQPVSVLESVPTHDAAPGPFMTALHAAGEPQRVSRPNMPPSRASADSSLPMPDQDAG